jgi:hypothetical protein
MENRIIADRVTSDHQKDKKTISKGELQTLMPKACVAALQDFVEIAQHVLRDGSITAGEYHRILKALEKTHLRMCESKRLKELASRGVKLGGRKKSLDRSLLPAEMDLEF